MKLPDKISAGVIAGTIVLMVWLGLIGSGVDYLSPALIQNWPVYKGLTGIALYILLLYQFKLSLRRFFPAKKGANSAYLQPHKNAGNWIPILLVVHTQEIGYGLTLILNIALTINLFLSWYGLLIRGKWYFPILSLHVILSLLVFSLATFHLFVAITFH